MDTDLLEYVSHSEDRDYAPFFAGRKAEIDAFERAVKRSKVVEQTQFRIFHGAPGSGKTSLLTHLRANAPENRVFVRINASHLTSHRALVERIDKELLKSSSVFAKGAAWVLRHGSFAAGGPPATAAGKSVAAGIDAHFLDRVRRESEVVLLTDEAQTLNPQHADVLRDLHIAGLEDLHTVFAFAGLAHTPSVIRGLDGLSRLSKSADVYMDLLAEEDCVESTRRMLDECGIGGDPVRREGVGRRVAAMAHRWPQHLACAHEALARELLRTGGDVGPVDLAAVGRQTAEARHEYYLGRLQGHPVLENARFTAAVVAAVRARNAAAAEVPPEAEPVVRETQIAQLCEMALAAEPEDSDIRRCDDSPDDIARRMVEKGILGRAPGKPYDATVPSMADWLAGHLAPRATAANHECGCQFRRVRLQCAARVTGSVARLDGWACSPTTMDVLETRWPPSAS